MGEFKSGGWIVGLLIYFFLFFLLLQSAINARAEYVNSDTSRIYINDPGFQDKGNSLFNTERCGGKGTAMTVLGGIPCKNLDVDDEITCNSFNGCTWSNETSLFNITVKDAGCRGYINLSHYDLNYKTRSTYCSNLDNESLCEAFRCVWLNQTTLAQQQIYLEDSGKIATFWETIKFVATFRADIGLGIFTFVFSFLFFYVPLVMMIWAIYMALPFLH